METYLRQHIDDDDCTDNYCTLVEQLAGRPSVSILVWIAGFATYRTYRPGTHTQIEDTFKTIHTPNHSRSYIEQRPVNRETSATQKALVALHHHHSPISCSNSVVVVLGILHRNSVNGEYIMRDPSSIAR